MIPNPFVIEPEGDPTIVPLEGYPTPCPVVPVEIDDTVVGDETPWDIDRDDPTPPLARDTSLGEPEYLARPGWLDEAIVPE
jgi:hypothetical protein